MRASVVLLALWLAAAGCAGPRLNARLVAPSDTRFANVRVLDGATGGPFTCLKIQVWNFAPSRGVVDPTKAVLVLPGDVHRAGLSAAAAAQVYSGSAALPMFVGFGASGTAGAQYVAGTVAARYFPLDPIGQRQSVTGPICWLPLGKGERARLMVPVAYPNGFVAWPATYEITFD